MKSEKGIEKKTEVLSPQLTKFLLLSIVGACRRDEMSKW